MREESRGNRVITRENFLVLLKYLKLDQGSHLRLSPLFRVYFRLRFRSIKSVLTEFMSYSILVSKSRI